MMRVPLRQSYQLPAGEFVGGGNALPAKTPGPVESFEPVDVPDYTRFARARMSTMAAEHVMGTAADQTLARRNQEGYQQVRLRPNVLVDVSSIDTRTTLLGQEMPFPIILGPAADHRVVHPEGELATAKGAGLTGATWIASANATASVEDIGRGATAPWWFQIEAQRDRGFMRELVQRAEAAGCRALVLALRTPEPRPLPAGMERPNFQGRSTPAGVTEPAGVWTAIDWLRSLTSMPIWLNGIVKPDDATRAVGLGVEGLIVSNRGAQYLDSVAAAVDALPPVVATVAGRVPVLVDGGIRRGTDVLKALGLGAAGVLIGRPYLHGLALNGAAGVAHVIRILRRELEMAMASTGRPNVAAIDSSVLWR